MCNFFRVVQRHPAFSNTATLVAAAVSNEGSKLEGDRASTGKRNQRLVHLCFCFP